jgi:hypothetical protein
MSAKSNANVSVTIFFFIAQSPHFSINQQEIRYQHQYEFLLILKDYTVDKQKYHMALIPDTIYQNSASKKTDQRKERPPGHTDNGLVLITGDITCPSMTLSK